MKSELLASFHDFQRVLVLCPVCGEIHRLSDLKLFYKGKIKHTWWDELQTDLRKIEQAEERFDEKHEEIKQKTREKTQKQLPKMLRKCVPTICKHGYSPQDLKAMFDPIDFVIFHGMNKNDQVKKVVLFDGPAHDKRREKIQKSIKTVIKKGNYDWHTVKLDGDGKIV